MKQNVKTKLIIALVLLVILAALIAGFFLSRRGDGEVRSAYDITKTTTAPEETTKPVKKKVVVPGAYVPILNRYQDALEAKSNLYALRKAGLSTLLTEAYDGEDAQKNVGFYVDDYNDDGTTDLVIGFVEGYQHYPYAVLDYYTIDNDGNAVNVFQSQPRDYYTAVTKARFLEKLSDRKQYTAWYLYGLNNNSTNLTFSEGLLRDYTANKEEPWFKAGDLDGKTANDKHLKTDAGKNRQKQLDNARVQLDYTAFSKYNRANKAK